MKSRVVFFCTIMALIVGCVDNINFNINKNSDQIVIVGSITTEPGPYTVEIYKASDFYESINDLKNRVRQARVTISSDDGQTEELEHVGSGVYKTSPGGIRGRVGRSYTLTVITSDERVYRSNRELITSSPPIDSLYFQYDEVEEFGAGNVVITKKFARVMVDVIDDPDQENFYRWTWSGTYKFKTFPELFTVGDGNGGRAPAPLPCSFFGCTCCICWQRTSETNELAIANDKLTNGNKIVGQIVANIPVNATTFFEKYHVSVSQRTLSKAAHEFWSLVRDQQTSATLFATPPATIRSNIININNPDELVWGYFEAADITKKSFFIDRSDIPSTLVLSSQDSVKNDCRAVAGATTQQPTFWE